jgi:hypothetical protein
MSLTIKTTTLTKIFAQTAIKLSKEARIEELKMIGPIDMKNTTIQPCPDHSMIACVVFKLVHSMLETKHLRLLSPVTDDFEERGRLTSA